jgi:hypothetical protein
MLHTDKIHLLFNEYKKFIFIYIYICGRKEYSFTNKEKNEKIKNERGFRGLKPHSPKKQIEGAVCHDQPRTATCDKIETDESCGYTIHFFNKFNQKKYI